MSSLRWVIAVLLLPVGSAQGATILGQDCGADCATTDFASLHIVTGSECYPGGTGECAKTVCSGTPCSAYGPFDIDITPTREVTYVYYERFSAQPTWCGGGSKSSRPFFTATSEAPGGRDFYGAPITFHCNAAGCGMYGNAFLEADVTYGPRVTSHNEDYCPNGHCQPIVGDGFASVAVTWANLNGDGISNMGTVWRKIRNHIRLPSSNTAADGAWTIWVDEEMIWSLTNVTVSWMQIPLIRQIRFLPQDDSCIPYDHYEDEITIYSGYVGPDGWTPPVDILAPPKYLRIVTSGADL
jgi:hypothetical protein